MAVQVNTRIAATGSPRWRKLKTWLIAFEDAAAYDPHAHAAETIRQLRLSVTSIESRILELERRDLS